MGAAAQQDQAELVTGDSGQHPLQYAATRGLVASHCRTGMPPCPYAAGTLAARCWAYGLRLGRSRQDGQQRENAPRSGEGGVSRETPPSSLAAAEHARRCWFADDDASLLRLVDAGFSQLQIASILERTPKSVERRLARLREAAPAYGVKALLA